MNKTDLDFDLSSVLEPLTNFTSDGPLPSPEIYEYYRDLNSRVLVLDHDIDDTLTDMSRTILRWNREDKGIPIEERQPIKIYINSYGGLLDICLHFIDVIKLSKTPVYTYNIGVAMSAGFYILLAGKKRFGLPSSQYLLHQGSGGASGTFEQSKSQMAHYEDCMEKLEKFVLENTQIDSKTYKKKKTGEWFLWADEALSFGVIDEIVTDIDTMF